MFDFDDDELVFAYTRTQALEDGVLIAVDDGLRSEAGFRWPIAMTAEAWQECIECSPEDWAQSETGRLWDVLTVLRVAIQVTPERRLDQDVRFEVIVAKGNKHIHVRLKALSGLGDDGLPVLTIMLPNQD